MNRLPLLFAAVFATNTIQSADYLVAIPAASAADAGWKAAAADLAAKHQGTCVEWNGKPDDLLPLLRQHQPRWLAVIGKPETFDPAFVRSLNRVTRRVDEDPWGDVRWGLITGATAIDAQRIVDTREALVIERGLTTTGMDFSLLKSGVTLSDGARGKWSEKKPGPGAVPEQHTWDEKATPEGTVGIFAKAWNESDPQLIVTSSHATQFNLEMPFSLGLIASHHGKFHVLTKAQREDFAGFLGGAMFTGNATKLGQWLKELNPPALRACPDSPKVWVAAGNCLIGDARKTADSMVVTALSSGGVRQFVGYVVPTWYGTGGWGVLGLWQANRGALSLADSMFLNQNKLIDETIRRFPDAMALNFDGDDIQASFKDPAFVGPLQKLEKKGVKIEKDLIGLIHDRDVVALWGDPKWEATFRPETPRAFHTAWSNADDGSQTLKITAGRDFESEVTGFLPVRMKKPKLEGSGDSLVADDFFLIRKLKLKAGESREFHITES